MGQILQPQIFGAPHRGMADRTVQSDALMSKEQMRLIVNMDTDAIGFLTGRNGYSRVGSAAVSAGNAGQGLLHHIGTTSQLMAFVNNEAYQLVGSTWTNVPLGFSGGAKIRSLSFLDRIYAMNGTNTPRSYSGSGSWGDTNLASAPTGSLCETYKQQMFIGNETSDRIDFSSVPDSTGTTITWPSGNNFLLNPNDGGDLTAIKRYGKEILFFKDNYTYRFNGRSADADPVIKHGTPSQETVVVTTGICFFYNHLLNAVLAYAGGYPTIISKPVRQFLKAIPTSAWGNLALRADDDHVELFMGDLTVDNLTFANMSCRFTISTQTWVLRSYANEFRVFADYNDGTDLWNLGFTSVGDVVYMDNGNDDLGTAIAYDLQTPWLVLGNNPAVAQVLGGFAVFVENSRALTVFYQTDIDRTWRPIGTTSKLTESFTGINAKYHRIRFRFTGNNAAEPAIFAGYSMLIPVIEGIEKEGTKETYG